MYNIKLQDGTIIENFELNGNNFIADGEIDSSVFDGKMSPITFINLEDNTEIVYKDGILANNTVYDGRSWLIFEAKTDEQKAEEMLIAAIQKNTTDMTAVEQALVEIYELVIGGNV